MVDIPEPEKLIDAKAEIARLREALQELATTNFLSRDDYKERAKEALQGGDDGIRSD